jgi:hypothetical protein
MGCRCLGTSIQLPAGLVYGGGSFWYPFPLVSLGIALLKMSDMRPMLAVTERGAYAGWSREGPSRGNGASIPRVCFGGGLAGLGVLVVDTLSLRTGHRGVVLAVSAAGARGCGDSRWNRTLEGHVSTSYSKTCDDRSVGSSISRGDLARSLGTHGVASAILVVNPRTLARRVARRADICVAQLLQTRADTPRDHSRISPCGTRHINIRSKWSSTNELPLVNPGRCITGHWALREAGLREEGCSYLSLLSGNGSYRWIQKRSKLALTHTSGSTASWTTSEWDMSCYWKGSSDRYRSARW